MTNINNTTITAVTALLDNEIDVTLIENTHEGFQKILNGDYVKYPLKNNITMYVNRALNSEANTNTTLNNFHVNAAFSTDIGQHVPATIKGNVIFTGTAEDGNAAAISANQIDYIMDSFIDDIFLRSEKKRVMTNNQALGYMLLACNDAGLNTADISKMYDSMRKMFIVHTEVDAEAKINTILNKK